jgi:hypothetical protein
MWFVGLEKEQFLVNNRPKTNPSLLQFLYKERKRNPNILKIQIAVFECPYKY